MASLAEIQRTMATAIMTPLTSTERMRQQTIDGHSMNALANALIKPNDRLSSFERLEIYNRQYWFRVLDCLYEDFPGTHALLGESKFHRLIQAYLEQHPSTSFTLRNLGSQFPQFIEANPQYTHPHTPKALDMARLEWAQTVAFDEAAKPAIDFTQLSNLTPDKIYLHLQPYITLLELNHHVDTLLLRIQQTNDRLRSEASNAVEFQNRPPRRSIAWRIKPEPVQLVVHRLDNIVYFKRPLPEQFALLKAIQAGANLEDACHAAIDQASSPDAAAENLQTWFTTWSSFRWFWLDTQ